MLSQHKANNLCSLNILSSCPRISFTEVYSRLIFFNIPYNMPREITITIKISSKNVEKMTLYSFICFFNSFFSYQNNLALRLFLPNTSGSGVRRKKVDLLQLPVFCKFLILNKPRILS